VKISEICGKLFSVFHHKLHKFSQNYFMWYGGKKLVGICVICGELFSVFHHKLHKFSQNYFMWYGGKKLVKISVIRGKQKYLSTVMRFSNCF
jgi:hypothetical protein